MGYKKRKTNSLPTDYVPNAEEQRAYVWCVEEGIQVGPLPVKGHEQLWVIGISSHWTPHEIKTSPEEFDKKEVWNKVYEYCLYYYNKRKDDKD